LISWSSRPATTQVVSATINFNFYTTSAVLFNTMSLPLEKKVGTQFGPPGNTRLVYFVDDLNLPEVRALVGSS
jgi:dynein heavy chain, axonemal